MHYELNRQGILLDTLRDTEVERMPSHMTLKGIGSKRHEVSEFTKVKMYLPGKNGKIASIDRDLHIVDNLSAKTLIGIFIMKPEDMIVNLKRDIMTIGACGDLEVLITVEPRGVFVWTTEHPVQPIHNSDTGHLKAVAEGT